jgi:hypothetical protein
MDECFDFQAIIRRIADYVTNFMPLLCAPFKNKKATSFGCGLMAFRVKRFISHS